MTKRYHVTADTRLGNKCDVCGKFRKPGELVEHELRELDHLGGLRETWWLECDRCRDAASRTKEIA